MIRIHSSPTGVAVHNMRNVLESHGIPCEVRGEFRRAGAGEIPVNEAWVELWVEDSHEEEARRILFAPAEDGASWTCPGCGETVEPQFARCWNCQRERAADGGA